MISSTAQGAEHGSSELKAKALKSLNGLPPFSPILTRLLASLAAEEVSFLKLGDLIEKDAVLAGNVLHLVNSALYGRRGTINSVRHALSLLGVNRLRNAVLGMSITQMWNRVRMPASWSMARFNLHSAATAILSDLAAPRTPVLYPEGAFVAGLLHDVGRLIIAMGLPEQHSRILERFSAGVRPLAECELEVLGFEHAEISAQALRFWNLPDPIQSAVLYHHNPLGDPTPSKDANIPLSHLIDAANRRVNAEGITILNWQNPDAFDSEPIERMLDSRAEGVFAEFKIEYAAMAPFFRP